MTNAASGATALATAWGTRACVFDAYGTLFDVNSAALQHRDALGDKTLALAALWREKQLQYTWLRTIQGRHRDFAHLTADAVRHALAALDIDVDLAPALMRSFNALAAFPEVPDMLRELRAAGFVTAILSNGSPPMLASLLEHAGLAGAFDAVVSVESVGFFKPHPKVYQCLVDSLGLRAGRICFVSSNGWDAYAGSDFGMRVVWCNRRAQPPEPLPGAPDAQVASLAELAALLGPCP
jgi:2-haloacid dehalogenase